MVTTTVMARRLVECLEATAAALPDFSTVRKVHDAKEMLASKTASECEVTLRQRRGSTFCRSYERLESLFDIAWFFQKV